MIIQNKKKTSKTGRTVGRPSTKGLNNKTIPVLGIVDQPSNYDASDNEINQVEMIYSNPNMFKKITNLFKQLAASDFVLTFDKTNITILTIDSKKTTPVLININCNKLNKYYCANKISMGIDVKQFNNIIQTIDKVTGTISLIIPKFMLETKLRIILHKPQLAVDKIFDLEISYVPNLSENMFDDLMFEKEYPISFTIPSTVFKKDMNDYSVLTDELRLEKLGTGNLIYSYKNINKKIEHKSIYNKGELIKLDSKIKPNEYFNISFNLEHIKLVANSLVSEYITASFHYVRKIILSCYLDSELESDKYPIIGTEVCSIKILIDTAN